MAFSLNYSSEGNNELDPLMDGYLVCSRLQGSEPLQLAYAEALYERYRANPFDRSLGAPLTSPCSLFNRALEVYKRQLFITEWMIANIKSLSEDPTGINIPSYFSRAVAILKMTDMDVRFFISERYGLFFSI